MHKRINVMKKFLFAAIALLMAGNAMAFDNEPKQGLTGMAFFGMTASNIRGFSSMDTKVGGTLGAKVDYVLPSAHGTYISAGIDWVLKGAKFDKSTPIFAEDKSTILEEVWGTKTAKLHYMELPIHVGFRYNVMKNLGVYGELGPYFAVGVGGKNKLDIDKDGSKYRDAEQKDQPKSFKKYKNNMDKTGYQRFDCGMGFRVGAEYNHHYNFMLGCDWGFTDMYRECYRNFYTDTYRLPLNKAKNFNFMMAVGYRF